MTSHTLRALLTTMLQVGDGIRGMIYNMAPDDNGEPFSGRQPYDYLTVPELVERADDIIRRTQTP